jgi:hypothetical protein
MSERCFRHHDPQSRDHVCLPDRLFPCLLLLLLPLLASSSSCVSRNSRQLTAVTVVVADRRQK